jgi:hypothetical protein
MSKQKTKPLPQLGGKTTRSPIIPIINFRDNKENGCLNQNPSKLNLL